MQEEATSADNSIDNSPPDCSSPQNLSFFLFPKDTPTFTRVFSGERERTKKSFEQTHPFHSYVRVSSTVRHNVLFSKKKFFFWKLQYICKTIFGVFKFYFCTNESMCCSLKTFCVPFQDSQCGTVVDVNIECAVKLVGTNCILYPVNSKDLQNIWVRMLNTPCFHKA